MRVFRTYWRLWFVLVVAVVAAVAEWGLGQPLVAATVINVAGLALAALMFWDMVQTLRSGKFGVDLLAITAVVATVAVGEYWAALIVLLMLTGGDALEDYAAHKANSELRELLAHTPTMAHRQEAGQLVDVAAADVRVDDVIVVRPGEVVPVDGCVVSGESLVDEANITGESRPVAKAAGSPLMSETVNGDAALTVTVTKTAADSQYQSIVRLVQDAASQQAPFVRLADRYAVPFTLLAYLIAGVAWYVAGDPVRFAEVLVVASPCPLILAAPIALVSGMSRTSREGIIVKSGAALEKLAAARTVAFDKTGTVTRGDLRVVSVEPAVTDVDKATLLAWAAAAEQHSGHILARALVTAVADQSLLLATDVAETTGHGVTATVAGQTVAVGQAAFVHASNVSDQTAVYVAVDGRYVGRILFADTIRAESPATMRRLHALGVQHLLMISGDRQATADAVADQAGIDTVYAEQLPADKIAVLKNVPKEQHPVIMVGDGVNDAPSLAVADVGIAMGARGATAASESADVVLLHDDLSQVATSILIARDTMVIARQAVLIGIGICTALMLVASTGVIPAIIGAMFQEVVDTVTILYALRARHGRRTVDAHVVEKRA
ncbi:heavy metal translocating P-type ATPase [Lacticaseibacillus thailandensis]|uniref:Cd(2+)-exporting ATPase n=1 Tax=Lacticaseibacillus thailandensis DSM 22698 = JCM 13996 TaxID=1423810 RepID=A0A0R2C4Z0_9LACO|nr:heavy metal translocating P-type ATPase [Lacticaseibacillus thailandensis]KRM86680.1 cation transport ATPase [Lacticaseibacillus thailandensis DSM 22698 = JCM 13996]